ncbi:MAG TPA: AAA family ATPase, partial [Planctomycetota bacterium]|nr:AAA family ATPase [Planctomycetota bacterium]
MTGDHAGAQPLPPLARHVGALLAECARAADRALLQRTAELLVQEHGDGHVCAQLADHQGLAGGGPPFPPAADWRRALLASGVCGDGTGDTPLVLDQQDRLYFLRQFRAEQRVAAAVRTRLRSEPLVDGAHLAEAFAAMPAPPAGGAIDWPTVALVAAARARFAVLTGGPGTGKTTTVARLLQLLLHLQPGIQLACCAPTGKAAARLQTAVAERLQQAGVPAEQRARWQATTLHRLLGYLPLQDAFRFDRQRPLPYDLVVVDEASMVDLSLLDALLAALRPDARLLLVGDRDQLASVAAGQVLGDLCRAAAPERGAGRQLAAAARACGQVIPVQEHAPPLACAVVALRENHRFGAQPGIAAFAAALAARDAAAAMTAL